MKWIGQGVYDFISRFRNDVYLESISTGTIASGGNLGLDSNNKIVKADEATGDITGVALTAGTGIDLTSIANATGGDYAATIGVDVSDFMTNGSDNRILTATSADAINAEELLTFDGNTLTVGAQGNTTQDALVVDCHNLTSGNGIFLDIETSLTTTNTLDCMHIDLDKSGSTAASQLATHVGLEIDMNDNASGNHAASQIYMTGIDIGIGYTNTNASVNYQRGVNVALTSGDTSLNSVGYHSLVTDGGVDFKAVSSADIGDYFTIATTTHGATTLATLDDDATAAHITLDADGDINLEAAGSITADKVIIGKQYRIVNCNFRADIGTTKYYLPLKSQDEQTVLTREEMQELAVCDGRLVSVTYRGEAFNTHSGDATVTFGVETNTVGTSYSGGYSVQETEDVVINNADDQHIFHAVFDSAKHWDSTDMFAISIQSDTDITGSNERIFITLVIEDDWSTYLAGATREIDSTP